MRKLLGEAEEKLSRLQLPGVDASAVDVVADLSAALDEARRQVQHLEAQQMEVGAEGEGAVDGVEELGAEVERLGAALSAAHVQVAELQAEAKAHASGVGQLSLHATAAAQAVEAEMEE